MAVLDVYNLALSKLDISQTVKSVNDGSNAAGSCNQFYDFARKRVLEKVYWDFATKAVALALLLDQSTLTQQSQLAFPGFRYIYARPVDAVRLLAVTTQYGVRMNPYMRSWWYDMSQAPQWGAYRPAWRQMVDTLNVAGPGNSINILTDQDSAWAVYVTDVPNTGLWSAAFTEAVAWNLASLVAAPLSANQIAKQNAIKMAELSITSATMITLNEQQGDPYPDSPAITARN